EQFPVLPPPYPGGEAELNPDKEADFKFDGFLAARAWYGYSLLPLPDPDREPSKAPDPRDIPRDRRLPRRPMLIIFRQGKPRAETYYADRLQDEGWDDGSGWQVDEGHSGRDRWFPNETVVLGTGEPWSRMAWDDAYTTWLEHGRANGLYLEPERLEAYRN